MTDENEFEGRVALVTGASGGIGSAISRGLAHSGAAVAGGYGSNADPGGGSGGEITAGSVRAQAFGADMADPEAPARLVAEVENALGPVDILVANHGLGRQATYEEVDAAAFDQTLAINLRAPFLLAQRALPGMRERGFGRILFISSVAAFRGGVVGLTTRLRKPACTGWPTFWPAERRATASP